MSLGVDTFHDDPISRFLLAASDFDRLGTRLRALDTPVVFVMEGGYATDALGDNITRVLRSFDDDANEGNQDRSRGEVDPPGAGARRTRTPRGSGRSA